MLSMKLFQDLLGKGEYMCMYMYMCTLHVHAVYICTYTHTPTHTTLQSICQHPVQCHQYHDSDYNSHTHLHCSYCSSWGPLHDHTGMHTPPKE